MVDKAVQHSQLPTIRRMSVMMLLIHLICKYWNVSHCSLRQEYLSYKGSSRGANHASPLIIRPTSITNIKHTALAHPPLSLITFVSIRTPGNHLSIWKIRNFVCILYFINQAFSSFSEERRQGAVSWPGTMRVIARSAGRQDDKEERAFYPSSGGGRGSLTSCSDTFHSLCCHPTGANCWKDCVGREREGWWGLGTQHQGGL